MDVLANISFALVLFFIGVVFGGAIERTNRCEATDIKSQPSETKTSIEANETPIEQMSSEQLEKEIIRCRRELELKELQQKLKQYQ